FFFLHTRRLSIFLLFPYTTLFRSMIVFLFSTDGHNQLHTNVSARIIDAAVAPVGARRYIARRSYPGKIFQPAQMRLVSHIVDVADRKSTRLNSSHQIISYAVFCLK